jgi:hypothetical protein
MFYYRLAGSHVRPRLGVAARLVALVSFIQHVTCSFFSCVLALLVFLFYVPFCCQTFHRNWYAPGQYDYDKLRSRIWAKGRRKDANSSFLPIPGVLADDLGVVVVNSGLSSSACRSVIRHPIIL